MIQRREQLRAKGICPVWAEIKILYICYEHLEIFKKEFNYQVENKVNRSILMMWIEIKFL